jgi:hypothetical protein
MNIELKDEAIYPDNKVLGNVLGQSYEAYKEILDLFDKHHLEHQWRYYKDGKAWLLKVQKKKKTIVWMSVFPGFLQAVIYFPARLLDDILALDISDDLRESIRKAKNIGKTRPCIFEIRDQEILADFEKVMCWKVKSK